MDNHLRQYIWEIIEVTVSNLKDDNEDYHKLIKDAKTPCIITSRQADGGGVMIHSLQRVKTVHVYCVFLKGIF